jgi:hypothetical protein
MNPEDETSVTVNVSSFAQEIAMFTHLLLSDRVEATVQERVNLIKNDYDRMVASVQQELENMKTIFSGSTRDLERIAETLLATASLEDSAPQRRSPPRQRVKKDPRLEGLSEAVGGHPTVGGKRAMGCKSPCHTGKSLEDNS